MWYPNLDDLARAEAVGQNNTITNITVQLGATAYLHCHVRSGGDRTISGGEVNICMVNHTLNVPF